MTRLIRWLFTPPNKRWVAYMRHIDEGGYSYCFKGIEFGVRKGRKRLPVDRVPIRNGYANDTEAFSSALVVAEHDAQERAAYLNAMGGVLSE